MAKLNAIHADVIALKERVGTPADRQRVEPYTVAEFCAIIRRSRMWVSTRCQHGKIRTLPGKPYRIPVSELIRYTERRS